ncbi:MAG: Nucleotidyltransferase/DNA polymerase [Chthoniobacteraceae bacterium]|nr:Nucleotidyltransferase/DNA polymerase [Chthoniobacteraceae bacterium]
MNLYAVIFVPDFALQAVLRNTPELRAQTVVLIAEKKTRILQMTPSAHAAGVTQGMTPTQAVARCNGLIIKIQSPDAERVARAALVECACSFSPFVEETAAGICTLRWDAEWPASQKKRPLVQLAAVHLCARLGIAPNADLALLAAQSADSCREVRAARDLAAVPIEILALPPHLLSVLGKWGIHTLGDFVALGRDSLAERLGAEILPFFDRASGRIDRPLRCIPPPEIFEESIEFENEIETLEPLLFILRRFLEQIALRLETAWLVASELELRLGFTIGAFYRRRFDIPSPTCDVDVLFRMLHTHLENFRAEHPIISLRLTATPSRPWRQQFGLFESALRDPNQFFETLARLGALLGEGHVGTPNLFSTHRPDAFFIGPVIFGELSDRRRITAEPSATKAPMAGLSFRRFRPARPAQVLFKKRPVFLQSVEVSGAIIDSFGPIRLSGNWWNGAPWSHNEWDVQLHESVLCRIYEEDGAWFLEGIYD